MDISEKRDAFIVRVEEYAKQEMNMKQAARIARWDPLPPIRFAPF
jgi:hypothetical protein